MAEPVTEEWTCMGVRVNAKGKRVVFWLTPDGTELAYLEKISYVTGGIYEVEVTRTEGHVLRDKPRYTRRWLDRDDPRVQKWHLSEMTAEQQLAREARERKDKAAGFVALDQAMEPLLQIARSYRTNAQRDALIADVIRRLSTPWR
jgi:hypothetical protein